MSLFTSLYLIIAADNNVDHALKSHPLQKLNCAFSAVGSADCNLDPTLFQPGMVVMVMAMVVMTLIISIIIQCVKIPKT